MGALAVVVDALRLLAAHWPVLLTIYLAGHALRNAALWAGMEISLYSSFVGAMLVPFAPLAALTALILMLRAVAQSMRHVDQETLSPQPNKPGQSRSRLIIDNRLALLSSTLIPFLAVYAAQGYLASDRMKWIVETSSDDLLNRTNALAGTFTDGSRTSIVDDKYYWWILGSAFALRWLIGRLRLADRNRGWGLFAAWLEITWVTLFANRAGRWVNSVWEWVNSRVLVTWIVDGWQSLTSALGPIGAPLRALAQWLSTMLGELGGVILVPIAWLAVAAVVFGRTLPDQPGPGLVGRVQRRLGSFPPLTRRWILEWARTLESKFEGLYRGIGLLASAGLVPMLVFCLVFGLIGQIELAGWQLVRWVTGPMALADSSAFYPWLEIIPRALAAMAIVVLSAAAADRLIGAAQARSEAAESSPDLEPAESSAEAVLAAPSPPAPALTAPVASALGPVAGAATSARNGTASDTSVGHDEVLARGTDR